MESHGQFPRAEHEKCPSSPAPPRLSLSLKATSEQATRYSAHSRGHVDLILKRDNDDDDDDDDDNDGNSRPCVVSFRPYRDAYAPHGLILRHLPSAKQVSVYSNSRSNETDCDHQERSVPKDIVGPPGNDFGAWELPRPGAEVAVRSCLAQEYCEKMVIGDRYELFWPGGEIRCWEWGTLEGLVGKELRAREESERIVLAGGASVCFTAVDSLDTPSLYRTVSPRRPSDRIPGAPILSVELAVDGPMELRKVDQYRRLDVNVTVTYYGIDENSLEAPPIIFHTFAITDPEVAVGLQHLQRNGEWEEVEDESAGGCLGYVDFPNKQVHVSDHEKFVSLKVGESWTTIYTVADYDHAFPEDLALGDLFRFRFTGCTLDWWDWGSAEDHVDTVVSLPSFGTYVWEPRDNGGRPKVVIPASSDIHFTYVG